MKKSLLSLVFLMSLLSVSAFASPAKPDAEAAMDALLEQADSVNVYIGAVKINSLQSILLREVGVLANKSQIAIKNTCSARDDMGIVECTLSLIFGDIAGGTTPARAVILSYSAQITDGTNNDKKVSVNPEISMEITN